MKPGSDSSKRPVSELAESTEAPFRSGPRPLGETDASSVEPPDESPRVGSSRPPAANRRALPTGSAPEAPSPLAATETDAAIVLDPSQALPAIAEIFDDFVIVGELGKGSFGRVYLARQRSLDRLVALKITQHADHEARTMARLEHPHIVQVFSETVLPERGLRVVCMQYVPGSTLERALTELRGQPRSSWTARAFGSRVQSMWPADPTERPTIERTAEPTSPPRAFVDAVCALGVRLAGALQAAHERGVLHRDIKPANVLLAANGEPLLADFNLATTEFEGKSSGCTLAYSAPEHLGAADGALDVQRIDERTDIFSLALVLREALTGTAPFSPPAAAGDRISLVDFIELRRDAFAQPLERDGLPEVVHRTLSRALAPDPRHRYESAADFGRALAHCRSLLAIERERPRVPWIEPFIERRPFLALLALVLVPQAIASVVNIAINRALIVSQMTSSQANVFALTVILYNFVAYPACAGLAWRRIGHSRAVEARLRAGESVSERDCERARRDTLAWPMVVALYTALGWVPGAVVFPLTIDALSGPVSSAVYGYFAFSFLLSAGIALAYSYFGAEVVGLTHLYLRFAVGTPHFGDQAASELRKIRPRSTAFYLVAALIPLGVSMALVMGAVDSQTAVARALIVTMIALGMAGFGLAIAASQLLSTFANVVIRHTRSN